MRTHPGEVQFSDHRVWRSECQLARSTPGPFNCNEHFQSCIAGEKSLPFFQYQSHGGSWDLARLLQQLLQSWTWNLKGVGGWNRWPLPTSKFLCINNTTTSCRSTARQETLARRFVSRYFERLSCLPDSSWTGEKGVYLLASVYNCSVPKQGKN